MSFWDKPWRCSLCNHVEIEAGIDAADLHMRTAGHRKAWIATSDPGLVEAVLSAERLIDSIAGGPAAAKA